MIVELISTGTELLLGQIVNTNAVWLAEKLNAMGYDVVYQTTVGDNRERMQAVFRNAMDRADIIITSGGLGPTQGDITKEVSAALLGRSLLLHHPSLENIEQYFFARRIPMPPNNIRQAMIPTGAIVLDNERGTAPGVILEHGAKTIVHLPGPPRELEWMFSQHVGPYLIRRYGSQGIILSRVLRIYGLGESSVEEKLRDLVRHQTNPTIALLAKAAEIHVRLTAKGSSEVQAKAVIATVENEIRQRLDRHIFGVDDKNLEMATGEILAARQLTVALAESCTGGLVTSRLTDVPGSSDYVIGSVVCYSNEIKERTVGVPSEILADYGAVSGETADCMARNIRQKFGSHIGVGITGIAGPGGATAGKPVGLVYIGIDGPLGCRLLSFNFSGERQAIKQRTSQAALFALRQYALEIH